MGSGLYLKNRGCVSQVETDGHRLYLKPYAGKGLPSYGDGLYLNEEESFTMEKDFCSVLIVRLLIYLFWELSYKTRMNIHKFNAKPKTISLKTIHWRPLREVKYPPRKEDSTTWEIFSQEEIKLEPREFKQLQLGLGFMMSEGVVLDNSLKYKRCSLQNETILEDAEDIVITLRNNSN